MEAFETSATVEDQGGVHLVGVPFAAGTQVEVTIRQKVTGDANRSAANLKEARARMRDLFARVRARSPEPIGRLHREELYYQAEP